MKKLALYRVLIAMVLAFFSVCGSAQRQYEPPATLERDHGVYIIKSDGSYVQTMERVFRVETAQGVEDTGSQQLSYISSQESIDSIVAWTIQPDGTRVPVPPESIRTRDEDNSGGASQFSDTRVRIIIFPKVEVGSRLEYKASSTTHTPPYPGEFNQSFVFSPNARYDAWQVRIELPVDRKLYVDKRGVSGGLEKTVDGVAHYVFRYARATFIAPESVRVGNGDYGDYLRVSTMPDMIALGRAYQATAKPKTEISEAIRTMALKLTAGKTDERARVRTLYHWVSRNIRYVGVSLGSGRLVPHGADEILHNRYGDCKDHVVILEALLAAVGIESSPALINAGSTYTLPGIGAHGAINHVITYVPGLDLYLDSTDRFSPFGTLPYSVMDKPVVLTALGRMGRTPPTKLESEVVRVDVTLKMGPDGSMEGRSSATLSGVAERSSRVSRFNAKASTEEDVVKELLFRFNETGSGSIEHPDPEDLEAPYWVKSTFTLDAVSNVPGRGAIAMPVGLAPGELAWTGADRPFAQRLTPFKCRSRVVEENYSLTLPKNVVLESSPRGTTYRDGASTYESVYRKTGQTVTVRRKLVAHHASNVCAPEENEQWIRFYKVIQRDLRAQIFYR